MLPPARGMSSHDHANRQASRLADADDRDYLSKSKHYSAVKSTMMTLLTNKVGCLFIDGLKGTANRVTTTGEDEILDHALRLIAEDYKLLRGAEFPTEYGHLNTLGYADGIYTIGVGKEAEEKGPNLMEAFGDLVARLAVIQHFGGE